MADIDGSGLLNFPEFVAVARQYQNLTNGSNTNLQACQEVSFYAKPKL